jgi:hypothetical protein
MLSSHGLLVHNDSAVQIYHIPDVPGASTKNCLQSVLSEPVWKWPEMQGTLSSGVNRRLCNDSSSNLVTKRIVAGSTIHTVVFYRWITSMNLPWSNIG